MIANESPDPWRRFPCFFAVRKLGRLLALAPGRLGRHCSRNSLQDGGGVTAPSSRLFTDKAANGSWRIMASILNYEVPAAS